MSPHSFLVPVVLAGGIGSRLWPLSLPSKPKQFLPLLGPVSPLGELLSVVVGHDESPVIVASHAHRELLEREVSPHAGAPLSIIAEEAPCSTAAAVCLAVLHLRERGLDLDDCGVLITSADIAFDWRVLMHRYVKTGVIEHGENVVFVVKPPPALAPAFEAVACCYGHLHVSPDGEACFVEKPSLEETRVLRERGALWSSGIYALCANAVLTVLREHHRAVLSACEQALRHARRERRGLHDWDLALRYALKKAPLLSLDQAIVCHLAPLRAVRLEGAWFDLGTWPSLHAACPQDESQNAASGSARFIKSRGCYVRAGQSRVTIVGLENVAVIEHEGEILVVPLDRAHEFGCELGS